MKKSDLDYFRRVLECSREALNSGNDGFASILVDDDGGIVLEQGNTVVDEGDVTAHDTIGLVRKAAKIYDAEFLSKCTLYAAMEPCVMCMGAIYWSQIGTVKFAVTEKEYGEFRGGAGLDIHSKEFAQRSPRIIKVEGPFPEVHDEMYEIIKTSVARKNLENSGK